MMSKKGFSMIEIVAALGILVVAIISILAIFPVGQRAEKYGESYTNAVNLATKWLEIYESRGWRDGYSLASDDAAWQTDSDYPKLTFKRIFSDAVSADSSDIVSIQVRWQDKGAQHIESFAAKSTSKRPNP